METEQTDIDGEEKLQRTVRMTAREYEVIRRSFGGVQSAFNHALKEAEEEEGWLPTLPKRLVPAYRAIRDYAITREKQNVDSEQLRNAVVAGCDCARKTAVRHLHDLKLRNLIYTFAIYGDEHIHFVACNELDQKTLKKISKGEKLDADKYFAEKYGSLPVTQRKVS